MYPSYRSASATKPEDYVEPDSLKQARDARHISKYVFPRQYGLQNPFNALVERCYSTRFPDYTDRENEIKVRR